MSQHVLFERREDGVVLVTLNRPHRHNACDGAMIAHLTRIFRDVGADDSARVVVLAARGASFSRGADIERLRGFGADTFDANVAEALELAQLLKAIHQCPRPVLAVVQGAAFAEGAGLVAASDIAIASETASFAFTEASFGMIPSVAAPYLVAAIGARACRRYFLTAESFSAAEALRLGLVHGVVPDGDLAAARDVLLGRLLAASPEAQGSAKELIRAVTGRADNDTLFSDTAHRAAKARASSDGREGVAALIEKRKPRWAGDPLPPEPGPE
ncbi:MAG: enoyl-CoA hydratase/isomerase family protein [Alphaproteobacteria bacterium]|nr:enoyl-CoA hydratase/isomerase family protein [Alphaproteobacteria bacterium]MBF0130448.1 enoyl-CoA hydratase/isomerase family protein [Alphaproteobacteria bacterium]